MISARIDTTSGVRVLSRRVVLQPFRAPLYDDYDIHPVDSRMLVLVRPSSAAPVNEIALVLNWFTELARVVRP